LDSGFSNDRIVTGGSGVDPAPADSTLSPAVQRFQSCRWRKAAENGLPEHCGHRDVLPMAGTTGFAPESWCADCSYYKAKRTPRKPPERHDDNWRRW
jgi:hypothetical protein